MSKIHELAGIPALEAGADGSHSSRLETIKRPSSVGRTHVSSWVWIGAVFFGSACSGDGVEANDPWNGSESQFAGERDEPELTAEERAYVSERLAEPGTTLPDSVFVGRSLRMGDAYLDLDPILERWDGDDVQDKGRILLDRGYVTERAGGVLSFSRPQAGDEVWLVVPQNLQAAFQQAVQNIANVSANDCLGPDFVNIKTPQELRARRDAEIAETGQVLDLNIMVTEVHADTSRCSGSPAGCADFPTTRNVFTVPPIPALGFPGETRRVFGMGANVSITPGDPNLQYLVTHELLHSMGLAHPREEIRFRKGLIPGTQPGDDGYPSVMHDRNLLDAEGNAIINPATGFAFPNPDVSLTLTTDDADAIATLYAPPCDLGPRQNYIIQAQTTCFGGTCQ